MLLKYINDRNININIMNLNVQLLITLERQGFKINC